MDPFIADVLVRDKFNSEADYYLLWNKLINCKYIEAIN